MSSKAAASATTSITNEKDQSPRNELVNERKLVEITTEWFQLKEKVAGIKKSNKEALQNDKDREATLKEEIIQYLEENELSKFSLNGTVVQIVKRSRPVKPSQDEIIQRLSTSLNSEKKGRKVWKDVYENDREVKVSLGLRVKKDSAAAGTGGIDATEAKSKGKKRKRQQQQEEESQENGETQEGSDED